MSRKETKNTVKPHTEAKLKFYIHYLERYLPILFTTQYVEKINIYDMFCGQAFYDDGKESGAVRAFKQIQRVQKFYPESKTEITLTLNDLSKKRIKITKEWLESQKQTFLTRTHNEDATDLIKKLIDGINNKQDSKTRNLVFIDPYGYKQIDKLLIEELLRNRRTEVIIFLPINQMTRFKDKTLGDDIEKDFLPLKGFVEQFDIDVDTISGDIDLIKAIEQSLTFKDEYFATSYHIKNQKGSYYALFFITQHILGLEKIVEVKWSLDDQQGSGFNHTNQVDMFLEAQKTDELEQELQLYLRESKNNNEIYEWTLKLGFKPKHTNKILQKFKKNNKIKVEYFLNAKSGYHLNYSNYKNHLIKVTVQLIS
ncbi:MAG: three-Cys-motif partner protein TcmP [Gammaproteobacteria bacterium]|nr:three-Cys-motif partner protein TcmP [Gammaproteobacteria bacterium]